MCLVFSPGWLMGCLNATKGNWKFMLKVQFKKIQRWIQHGCMCLSVHFLNKSQYDEMLFNVFCWNKVSHVYASNITCVLRLTLTKALHIDRPPPFCWIVLLLIKRMFFIFASYLKKTSIMTVQLHWDYQLHLIPSVTCTTESSCYLCNQISPNSSSNRVDWTKVATVNMPIINV